MGYTPQTWNNAPAQDSPINAPRLQHMERGIAEAHALAEGLQDQLSGTASAGAAPLSRNGAQLLAGGKPIKLVGLNAFDLILNDAGGVHRSSKSFVDGKLGFLKSLGANWVRCLTAGANIRLEADSGSDKFTQALITGYTGSGTDARPVWNAQTLDLIDYTIARTYSLGQYFQITLCDLWQYFHGGLADWVRLGARAGIGGLTDMPSARAKYWDMSTADKATFNQFFTNDTFVTWWLDNYVSALLDHVNPYTGKRIGDHSHIIWELGNELGQINAGNLAQGPAWAARVAARLKAKAPGCLVADGYMSWGGAVSNAPGISIADIDIVGTHYYLQSTFSSTQLDADYAVAQAASKPYMIGEFAWSRYDNGQQVLDWVEAHDGCVGAAAWALIDPLDQHSEANPVGVLTWEADDIPLHYPVGAAHSIGTGNTPERRAAVQRFFEQLRAHASKTNARDSENSVSFVKADGTFLRAGSTEWTMHAGAVYSTPNASASDLVSRAIALRMNTIRITNFLPESSGANLSTVNGDPVREQYWVLVDALLAEARRRGLRSILDLSTYRNMLKNNGANPYTTDWTPFLTFVARRVNTVNGIRYGQDDSIALVSFAGEPDAPGVGDPTPQVRAQRDAELLAFYSSVFLTWRALSPILRSTGGLLAVDWDGVPWRQIIDLPGLDVPAMHLYGDGDLTAVTKFSSYAAQAGKPWINEESGVESSVADADRAARISAFYQATRDGSAAGTGFWHVGAEGGAFTHDVNPENFPLAWQAVRKSISTY